MTARTRKLVGDVLCSVGLETGGTCPAIATVESSSVNGFRWFACDAHCSCFFQCDGRHILAVAVVPIAKEALR